MTHIQLSIKANKEQQEILIGFLSDAGAEGFEETDTVLLAYFNETGFDKDVVNELLKEYEVEETSLQEKNWNEEWEKNFDPVVVENFCAVRAHFHAPITDVQHEILITPKMSFGTGHHATTYMMMQQMQDINFREKKVFDFGTGTGVLAILAEKLGAASVSAIDVDHWSVENTIENVANNQCKKIETKLSADLPDDKFDIILANINRNVILEYLPALKTILHKGGHILFSGLLTTDEEDVNAACVTQGFTLLKQLERNNWISLLFVN